MWLARGVQSAVFYYATCTPCAAAVDRRRRKRDAVRAQREQAKSTVVVTDQPRPFAQPTPFSTNTGWAEEITLGPGPPTRRHRAKNCQSDGMAPPRLSATSSTTIEDGPPSEREKTLKASLGERFHWARYQREDEVLWGEEGEEEEQQQSARFPGRARAGTSHSNQYYVGRAPPVNDLHPPIVSGPTSRAETRWMMQPPPTARVMAGKARHDSVRKSKAPSTRRAAARLDMKIEETAEEYDDLQEGQSIPMPDRKSWFAAGTSLNNRKATDKKRRPPPVAVIKDLDRGYISSEALSDCSPRYPPAATLASRPESMAHIRHAYDEWHLPISSTRSDSPSSLGSDSLHCPDTPYSRPESKRTEDSGKAFRSPYANIASPMGRPDDKGIEAIRVEVDEPKSREQMRPLKWRWSFDV